VKKAWSNLILDAIRHDVYVSMRARIALRKANISLTDGALTKEVWNIKNHKAMPVTASDIIAAFSCGDEVSFDVSLQAIKLTRALGN
jgi:hypothetical protein